jgi:DNA-binding CsgD family transcriptional regulator
MTLHRLGRRPSEGVFDIAADGAVQSHEEAAMRLTKREIEVLGLVLEGKSSKEVATLLCCSKRTVDFHLARVYEKLNVSNRVQAMRRVAMLGLIPIESEDEGNDGRYRIA